MCWYQCAFPSWCIIMDNCPICNHKVLQHARKVICIVCSKNYHLKCISIDPDYMNEIEKIRQTWYCCDCLSSILPFNCIDDDNEFLLSINDLVSTSKIQCLSDILFCPACRTTLVATRFRVAVICPIIQVPHCIRVFFYFVWFVFINHIFQFYYELCTYCNILDIYL